MRAPTLTPTLSLLRDVTLSTLQAASGSLRTRSLLADVDAVNELLGGIDKDIAHYVCVITSQSPVLERTAVDGFEFRVTAAAAKAIALAACPRSCVCTPVTHPGLRCNSAYSTATCSTPTHPSFGLLPLVNSTHDRLLDLDEKAEDSAMSGLRATLHGNVYQLRLLMLFMWRALQNGVQFRLATELSRAAKFDDVVYKRVDPRDPTNSKFLCRFLQAKHKFDDEKRITCQDLLTTGSTDEFSLPKYFRSHREIVATFAATATIQDLVLCTNIDLDWEKPGVAADPRSLKKGHFRLNLDNFEEVKPGDLSLDAMLDFSQVVSLPVKPQLWRIKLNSPAHARLKEVLTSASEQDALAAALAAELLRPQTDRSKDGLPGRSRGVWYRYHAALKEERVIDVTTSRLHTAFTDHVPCKLSPAAQELQQHLLAKLPAAAAGMTVADNLKSIAANSQFHLSAHFGRSLFVPDPVGMTPADIDTIASNMADAMKKRSNPPPAPCGSPSEGSSRGRCNRFCRGTSWCFALTEVRRSRRTGSLPKILLPSNSHRIFSSGKRRFRPRFEHFATRSSRSWVSPKPTWSSTRMQPSA
jgi:hypothetical protein